MKIKILDQVREYDAPVTVYDAAKDMELITRAVIGAEIDGKRYVNVIITRTNKNSTVKVKESPSAEQVKYIYKTYK